VPIDRPRVSPPTAAARPAGPGWVQRATGSLRGERRCSGSGRRQKDTQAYPPVHGYRPCRPDAPGQRRPTATLIPQRGLPAGHSGHRRSTTSSAMGRESAARSVKSTGRGCRTPSGQRKSDTCGFARWALAALNGRRWTRAWSGRGGTGSAQRQWSCRLPRLHQQKPENGRHPQSEQFTKTRDPMKGRLRSTSHPVRNRLVCAVAKPLCQLQLRHPRALQRCAETFVKGHTNCLPPV
jgi:hypothetical protein